MRNRRFIAIPLVSVILFGSANVFSESSVEERLTALERVNISGSFRANFTIKDFDKTQQSRGGDMNFNVFTLQSMDSLHQEQLV